jgi:hypothetical protein
MLYAQQANLFGMRAVLCLLPAPYITMCDFLPPNQILTPKILYTAEVYGWRRQDQTKTR